MEESFKDSLSEVYLVIQNSDIDIIKKILKYTMNNLKILANYLIWTNQRGISFLLTKQG